MGKATKAKKGKSTKGKTPKKDFFEVWRVNTIANDELTAYGLRVEDESDNTSELAAHLRAQKYIDQIIEEQKKAKNGKAAGPDIFRKWEDGSRSVLYEILNGDTGRVEAHDYVLGESADNDDDNEFF